MKTQQNRMMEQRVTVIKGSAVGKTVPPVQQPVLSGRYVYGIDGKQIPVGQTK